ncbi:MAG TPA: glutamate decarboxylase [Acidimicrobiales bacterium]|nr:glutamate decarboxylase [Acidimicrobiales bacterium]
MPLHRPAHPSRPAEAGGADELSIHPTYAGRAGRTSIPKFRLPDDELDAASADRLVRDELLLDGSAQLNLATFVTTWMEPTAAALMADTADKNMVDKDEYPQTAALEERCVHMLAHLWHAPTEAAVGCSTTGSSEAAMLAGMALKWQWRGRREAAGRPTGRPNLVMGTNVQVCWEKFCRYWDVEPRYVPMVPGRLHLGADEAAAACDDDTIGVVAVLGSTQDGSYEPVADICAALDRLAAGGGPDVAVHVDAASGGFIAPFLDADLTWDFRLPRVASINASGHKYGLVYPGVGWVLWRDHAALPEELVFHVNYLGGSMPTFALNFSRPGAQVVAQYFQFVRLGHEGYRRVQQTCRDVARHLAREVGRLGPFELLSDGSELPVFAFRKADGGDGAWTVFDVSDGLRRYGWQVPAYTLPADLTDVAVMRIVVRNGFSRDLADTLLSDLRHVLADLGHGARAASGQPEPFHH